MVNIFQQPPFNILAEHFPSVTVVNLFELLIVAFIIYKVFKYISGTKAEAPFKGVLMLMVALILSKLFKLEIIGRILESVFNILIFSIVVIFQPELRKLLGYIGQPAILGKNIFNPESRTYDKNVIDELTEAIKYLSKSRIGALMVVQDGTSLESYMEVGTRINSDISTELLLTIFHPNTPLHDGALIIDQDKILAAGVLLPLTEDPNLSWKYGTRHRAAIGMSEVSDATCIVVSEETGEISLAKRGTLEKFNTAEDLRTRFETIFAEQAEDGFSDAHSNKINFKYLFNNIVGKKDPKVDNSTNI